MADGHLSEMMKMMEDIVSAFIFLTTREKHGSGGGRWKMSKKEMEVFLIHASYKPVMDYYTSAILIQWIKKENPSNILLQIQNRFKNILPIDHRYIQLVNSRFTKTLR